MKITIIGAHLDDNVLSLGQYMAGVARSTSVTVFAGIPHSGLSDYDLACGFTSSSEAMRTRRVEDFEACNILNAEPVHLDFMDSQYRQPVDDSSVTLALRPFFAPDVWTFAPLGIGHPDHVQVARCARAACTPGEGFYIHEDLPARVLQPEQVFEALDKIRAEGFEIAELPHPIEVGSRDLKAAAIARYASQFRDDEELFNPCFYVPERAWCVRKLRPR